MEEEFESQRKESEKGFFLFVWELIKITVLALIIIVPIRYFIAQPFFVKGASMEPAFEDGDYLIINEISYRFKKAQRGDVIVFRFPEDPKQFFIKRIIALPDETIQIRNGKIVVFNEDNPSGFTPDESEYLGPRQITEGNLKMILEDDEYFVLGDNRLASSDSRRWGVLNKKFIIGKILLRAWPLDEIKYFAPILYSN